MRNVSEQLDKVIELVSAFDERLEQLAARMDAIEQRAALGECPPWHRDEGPAPGDELLDGLLKAWLQ